MKSSKAESDSKKLSKNVKSVESIESPPKSKGRASPSRSPARGRKLSPGPKSSRKSPSRKSPSRKSPSRKSPSRKSPSRKSPSRNTKDIDEPSKSPSRRAPIKTESKSNAVAKVELTKLNQAQKKLADANGGESFARDGLRERKGKSDEASSDKIGSRRSIRIKAASDNYEKLLSLAQSIKLPKSDQSFETSSDEEDDKSLKKTKSPTRTLVTPTDDVGKATSEFGGRFGVLCQLIILVLLVAGVNVACNKSQCNFKSLPNLQQFKNFNVWFSWKAALAIASYDILQFIIYFIPCCGKKVALPDTDSIFRANGLFALCVIIISMLVLEYFNVSVFHIVYEEYFALMSTASIFGVLFGVLVFVLSRKVSAEERNQYGNTGYFLYDFWCGREINPVLFGKVNLKLLAMRASLGAFVIMNLVYLFIGVNIKNFPILNTQTLIELQTYKQILGSISVNLTLLTFVSLQVLYAGYALLKEASIVSTFEYQHEGTGLMLTLGYALYPFTTSLINKCILEHNIVLSKYVLAVAVLVYFIGFYIYHASNAQKNMFRENPLDPKLAHLDSIPTFQGKRLLVSGWWGFVKHPNYLGDIILHLSLSTPVLSEPPVIFIVFTVLFLVMRASRDGARCRSRYGAAWERYCRRVPYNLVPKLY